MRSNTETRFITFTIYEPNPVTVFCLTEEQFYASISDVGYGIPDDYCDFIWQFAPNRETAKAQHYDKLDEREAWLNAGNEEKDTY